MKANLLFPILKPVFFRRHRPPSFLSLPSPLFPLSQAIIFFILTHIMCWDTDKHKERVTLQLRGAMTGISEELTLVKILFWPGGQASMRRKHRLGHPFSWGTRGTSAGGGGRRRPRPTH